MKYPRAQTIIMMGMLSLLLTVGLKANEQSQASINIGNAHSPTPKANSVPNIFNFPMALDMGNGRFEHVSGGAVVSFYGSGYTVLGPALQAAYGGQHTISAVDDDGNIYMADHFGNRIYAIIDGRMLVLAGSGRRKGFRDDCPAGQANFSLRQYRIHSICAVGSPAKARGAVFIADNDRIRRIWIKDKKWWVDTYAGGGERELKIGERALAKTIKLNSVFNAVCRDNSQPDTLFMLEPKSLVIITADGYAKKIEKPAEFYGQGLQTNNDGVLFGWQRERNFTSWNLKSDSFNVLGVDNPVNAKKIYQDMQAKYGKVDKAQWDGPADKCDWYCPASWMVDRGSSAVYASGGDDWTCRRIMNGMVKTLASDGKFHLRQAIKPDGQLKLVLLGSPMGTDAAGGTLWKAGPYEGQTCIIRYLPGKNTEVEDE